MTARARQRGSALGFAAVTGLVLTLAACTSQSAATSTSTPASAVATQVSTSAATSARAVSGTLSSAASSATVAAPSTAAGVATTAAGTTGASTAAGTAAASTRATTTSSRSTTDGSTRASRPTSVVPAPGGGNVAKTVASAAVTTAAPVPLSSTATVSGRLTASIVKVTRFTATARGAGEVSGPAIAVTVRISNGSTTSVDLEQLVVNVSDKAGAPGSPMLGSPAEPLAGSVTPGAKADGVYVFALPASQLSPISVNVSVNTATPVVLFVGNVK